MTFPQDQDIRLYVSFSLKVRSFYQRSRVHYVNVSIPQPKKKVSMTRIHCSLEGSDETIYGTEIFYSCILPMVRSDKYMRKDI